MFACFIPSFSFHCAYRWVYWSDWGSVAKIEKASMDGKNQTVIVDTNLVWPNGLTLDSYQQVLYWIDAYLDRIESSSVNGSRRIVVSSERIYRPFGISVYRGILYFTDSFTGVNIVTSNGGTVRTIYNNLCDDAIGIEVVSAERQPAGKYHMTFVHV